MIGHETRVRLRQQLMRRRERELKLRKDFYPVKETAAKLGISVATLWKHLKDPSLDIEKFTEGPRKKRLISADDIRKIWWKRHIIMAPGCYALSEQPTEEHKAISKVS